MPRLHCLSAAIVASRAKTLRSYKDIAAAEDSVESRAGEMHGRLHDNLNSARSVVPRRWHTREPGCIATANKERGCQIDDPSFGGEVCGKFWGDIIMSPEARFVARASEEKNHVPRVTMFCSVS